MNTQIIFTCPDEVVRTCKQTKGIGIKQMHLHVHAPLPSMICVVLAWWATKQVLSAKAFDLSGPHYWLRGELVRVGGGGHVQPVRRGLPVRRQEERGAFEQLSLEVSEEAEMKRGGRRVGHHRIRHGGSPQDDIPSQPLRRGVPFRRRKRNAVRLKSFPWRWVRRR